jgi:hypothetical protein
MAEWSVQPKMVTEGDRSWRFWSKKMNRPLELSVSEIASDFALNSLIFCLAEAQLLWWGSWLPKVERCH